MLELPEVVTIARQMQDQFAGKRIVDVSIAKEHPKFMFLNEDLGAYETRLVHRRITEVTANGKWIFATLDSEAILLLGEMFGRIRYVAPGAPLPKKVHAAVTFESAGQLVVTIQAWGGFQVLSPGELAAHPYAGNPGLSPIEQSLSLERLNEVLNRRGEWSRKPIKAFLVHEGNVCGIGNGYLQDILFRAKLSPKRKVPEITQTKRERLLQSIVTTMTQAIAGNGRDTEKDLYGAPGRYVPILDRRARGKPCPECEMPIQKISYLGGSCYICPTCQPFG